MFFFFFVTKTELVIFESKRRQFDGEIKLRLSRKDFPTYSVKYLGVKIDGKLSWKSHVDYLSVKLNRAYALLFQIKNLVISSILRTIYFAIFESHLNYCSLVWPQNCNLINHLVILQKKLLELLALTLTLTLTFISEQKQLQYNCLKKNYMLEMNM